MDDSQKIIFAIVAICYLYFFIYFPKMNNPNEHVRVYMTKSIADHGALQIGVRVKNGMDFRDIGYAYEEYGYVDDKALSCFDKRLKPPDCE
ncbi:MAG: hypothetical protein FJ088_11815, partial [Deltaproteobacteria bacterium]|nr:hypothetical protein [Deltaproteobacteria bacterium]